MKINGLIFFLLLVFLPFLVLAQENYQKNPLVIYEVDKNDASYTINYTFRDQFLNLQTFEMQLPVQETQRMIDRFGVPMWMLEPYADTEENRRIRQIELEKALFQLNDNTIEIDKSAVIDYYGKYFCKPVAEMIVSSLTNMGKDNREERINLAMRFVQDIPYAIPKYEDEERHFGGVSPPPQLLLNGYGDCDSKVLLFVGILTYLIPGEDVIFLNQKNHVLSAIKARPEKNDTYIRYKGDKWLIAETAGPGRRKLGEKGDYFNNRFTVEDLNVQLPEVIPFGAPTSAISNATLTEAATNTDRFILNNTSSREFRFELSYDRENWKSFYLPSRQSGEFNIGNEDQVYLRYRAKKNYVVFKVIPGNDYSLDYNQRKKIWEMYY